MDDPDGDYAPQSPDLSAYHSAPAQADPYGYATRSQTHYGGTTAHPPYAGFQPGQTPYGMTPDSGHDTTTNAMSEPRSLRKSSRGQLGEADVEVKTKFPVARIKRIMQADEDVGKVSQVTPVAVCKS